MSHTFRYRVPAQPTPGARIALTDSDAHHLLRVVRRAPGDAVEVISPSGEIWPATVAAPPPHAILEVGAAPLAWSPPASVTMFIGLCEWGRLDVAVEKCTELGIVRLVIYAGARSRRLPDRQAWGRRRARLMRVGEAATRQSGQGALPEIDGVWTFPDVCAAIAGGPAIVLDPRGTMPFGHEVAGRDAGGPLAIVVGPDAGLTEAELAEARAAGAAVCHLGQATLRAETAVIVAAGIALNAAGHLDRGPADAVNHGEDD